MKYRIRVRNKDLKFIGEVGHWISLEVHLLYNELSKWSIEIDASSKAAELFWQIASDESNEGRGGVYIERDGHFLLSGPMTEFVEYATGKTKTYKASGTCDLLWLANHLAAPHPRYFNSPYMTVDGTTTRGHADYIPNRDEPQAAYSSWHIHTAVRTNIGEGAPAQRPPLPFLTTRDNSVGYVLPSGEYTIARGENLFELCRGVADHSEYMGYPIRMTAYQYDTGDKDDDGTPIYKVRFECLESQNRPNVILSPDFGTIGNYTYTQRAPQANMILMGGSGEGNARRFAFEGDPKSIAKYGRIESFQEYTGFQNDDQNSQWNEERAKLLQEIRMRLAEQAEQTIFEFEFREMPTIKYGRDFVIGDQVSIQLRGKTTTDIVRRVSFLTRGHEERIELVVGKDSFLAKGLRLFDDIEDLKYRYTGLIFRNKGE